MPTRRILAITPSTGRIGFAYFEDDGLVEWGTKIIGAGPTGTYVTVASTTLMGLVRSYEPDVILLPSRTTQNRRSTRGRLIRLATIVLTDNVGALVEWAEENIRNYFANRLGQRRPTKHAIMRTLAVQFPELEISLPPPRRPWDPQPYALPLFDSVARVVARRVSMSLRHLDR